MCLDKFMNGNGPGDFFPGLWASLAPQVILSWKRVFDVVGSWHVGTSRSPPIDNAFKCSTNTEWPPALAKNWVRCWRRPLPLSLEFQRLSWGGATKLSRSNSILNAKAVRQGKKRYKYWKGDPKWHDLYLINMTFGKGKMVVMENLSRVTNSWGWEEALTKKGQHKRIVWKYSVF